MRVHMLGISDAPGVETGVNSCSPNVFSGNPAISKGVGVPLAYAYCSRF